MKVVIEESWRRELAGEFEEPYFAELAEFVRGAFEKGVPITIGTDCHGPKYNDRNDVCRQYLGAVGFKAGDFAKPRFRKPRTE